jgi:acyl-CoA hydrolase
MTAETASAPAKPVWTTHTDIALPALANPTGQVLGLHILALFDHIGSLTAKVYVKGLFVTCPIDMVDFWRVLLAVHSSCRRYLDQPHIRQGLC